MKYLSSYITGATDIFSVDPVTGFVSISQSLDREDTQRYQLTVKVRFYQILVTLYFKEVRVLLSVISNIQSNIPKSKMSLKEYMDIYINIEIIFDTNYFFFG